MSEGRGLRFGENPSMATDAASTDRVALAPLPDRIRHRFPIFERRLYVNSCSQGALSDAVRAAYEQYLADWDEKGAPWEYWVERGEAARATFARLVNAAPDEVAVTTSLSAGVSALATGLRYARRSKVVLTDWEFPTIGQIWHAQEARGARVVHVPESGDGTIPLEHFERVIDDDTQLVSITHVCYRNGAKLDVEAVTRLAHERGALVLLDAYQTIGSLPVDVRALGVDFLGAGVLKYLLGSAGLAFFYARRELVERVWPTATGWFADRDIFAMDHRDYSPAPTASRFQSGTPPIPAIYAGIAGMELMEEIGIAETREHVLGLHARLLDGLDSLGARVATPRDSERRGALLCVASTDAPALVQALDREGIVTSSRAGNLRISPHAYNSVEDVDVLLETLSRHIAYLL
jgi:selenocysteine lyase/cysteine desulfurase